MSTFEYSN